MLQERDLSRSTLNPHRPCLPWTPVSRRRIAERRPSSVAAPWAAPKCETAATPVPPPRSNAREKSPRAPSAKPEASSASISMRGARDVDATTARGTRPAVPATPPPRPLYPLPRRRSQSPSQTKTLTALSPDLVTKSRLWDFLPSRDTRQTAQLPPPVYLRATAFSIHLRAC